jgi:hypothetical protein
MLRNNETRSYVVYNISWGHVKKQQNKILHGL